MTGTPTPRGGPARPPRPRIVTISCLLLALAAVAELAVLPLTYWHQAFFETAAESFEPESGVAFAAVGSVAVLGADLLTAVLAIGLLVLSAVNAVGVNGARIASWVAAPLFACCATVGVARSPRPLSFMYSDENLDRITALARDRMPEWLEPVLFILGVGAPLAVTVALVLLALPSANEFFRRWGVDPAYPEVSVPMVSEGEPIGRPDSPSGRE
ncbi:hypothetical protein [Micromonospora sp. DT231]|uniref:hypothetical protein n=1 Tax=Micromonospora sp. DT231 TaxID=3416526 RepID=UPI003CF83ACF